MRQAFLLMYALRLPSLWPSHGRHALRGMNACARGYLRAREQDLQKGCLSFGFPWKYNRFRSKYMLANSDLASKSPLLPERGCGCRPSLFPEPKFELRTVLSAAACCCFAMLCFGGQHRKCSGAKLQDGDPQMTIAAMTVAGPLRRAAATAAACCLLPAACCLVSRST